VRRAPSLKEATGWQGGEGEAGGEADPSTGIERDREGGREECKKRVEDGRYGRLIGSRRRDRTRPRRSVEEKSPGWLAKRGCILSLASGELDPLAAARPA